MIKRVKNIKVFFDFLIAFVAAVTLLIKVRNWHTIVIAITWLEVTLCGVILLVVAYEYVYIRLKFEVALSQSEIFSFLLVQIYLSLLLRDQIVWLLDADDYEIPEIEALIWSLFEIVSIMICYLLVRTIAGYKHQLYKRLYEDWNSDVVKIEDET